MKHLHFSRETTLPVSADDAFEWHLRPGAFVRLMPPWAPVIPVEMPQRLTDGCIARFDVPAGPIKRRWVARHVVNESERWFQDIAESGPVPFWVHTHSVFEESPESCRLRDAIEFELPLGMLGRTLGQRWIQNQLAAMFAYRHRMTADDLRDHDRYRQRDRLKIGITGSGGLVGSALTAFLTTGGHEVIRLVRRPPRSDDEVQWNLTGNDPQTELLDEQLSSCDAIVHLAGENIAGGRWTAARKELIHASRRDGTRLLAERLAGLKTGPRTLITASAIGFYGDRGDEQLDESADAGSGFLANVCADWESATRPAAEAGIRTVSMRLGVVLTAAGGALKEMLLPFRLGAGGPVGTGRQWWSWVAMDDVLGAVHHALMQDDLRGPINVVAPDPEQNREFARVLGRVLHRPSFVPMPRRVARTILGQMVDELLLASARVAPRQLMNSGYAFRFARLEDALRHELGRLLPVTDR